jgi:GT2 family glycosyltransferase
MTVLSVIIVTWNSEEDIKECIDSLITALEGINAELIIIDNQSQDNTFRIINKINYPALQTIQNAENEGFTKAVNRGLNLARGKYVLLLNPDTKLKQGSIRIMLDFLESNKGYGAAAPMMRNTDGTIQHSIRNFPTYWGMFCEFSLLAYIFPKTKTFGSWKAKYFDYEKEQDANQPMAAALMIRKSFFDETGLIDQRYVMFFNDVDLCKSIYSKGYKIRYLPQSEAIHKHGSSIKKDRINMIRVWNKDCVSYFEKHYGKSIQLRILKLLLFLSGLVRIGLIKLLKKQK